MHSNNNNNNNNNDPSKITICCYAAARHICLLVLDLVLLESSVLSSICGLFGGRGCKNLHALSRGMLHFVVNLVPELSSTLKLLFNL